ncbi:hypothetical protein FDECE_12021 [Fusarium decemcellulare]|nr:hypothetical protein FDECE_12021 [Fusarium decemcellulare]
MATVVSGHHGWMSGVPFHDSEHPAHSTQYATDRLSKNHGNWGDAGFAETNMSAAARVKEKRWRASSCSPPLHVGRVAGLARGHLQSPAQPSPAQHGTAPLPQAFIVPGQRPSPPCLSGNANAGLDLPAKYHATTYSVRAASRADH